MYNFPRDTKTVSLCFCSKQARSLRHDDQGFPSEDSLVQNIFSTSSYEDSLFLVSGVTVSAIWPQVIGRRLDPIMCSWQGVVSQWFHKWAGFDDWHFYSSRHVKVLFGACWQQKNVHFVKLSKCETVFTIAFLSSRRSKNIYGTSNSKSGWRSYAVGKMSRCREFWSKSGLPTVGSFDGCRGFREAQRNLLGCLGLSLRREFWQKLEVPTVGSSDPSRDFRHT